MRRLKDRRRAQAGATLVELLVSQVIIGLALVLVVGTFSTGLLNASLAKRNTAVEAAIQYEMDRISGSPFASSAASYSECFATENPAVPQPAAADGSCPASFALRADVTVVTGSPTPTSQTWTITITQVPNGGHVGNPTSLYKVNR